MRRPCYRPVAVLVRSSPGRRRGEQRAPRLPTTQPRQVRNEGGSPTFHVAKSARDSRNENQMRRPRPLKCRAADMSQSLCGRAEAEDVGRSAPCVGPQQNHAKSALRGACSAGGQPTLQEAKSARDARRGIQRQRPRPLASRATDLSRCCCGRAQADGVGRSVPALAHNTTTPSSRCTERAPQAVGRLSTRQGARATRATEFESGGHDLSNAVPQSVAMLVRSSPG